MPREGEARLLALRPAARGVKYLIITDTVLYMYHVRSTVPYTRGNRSEGRLRLGTYPPVSIVLARWRVSNLPHPLDGRSRSFRPINKLLYPVAADAVQYCSRVEI